MAAVTVVAREGGWRLEGDWADVAASNLFLEHLVARGFAHATVRAYAYDLLNFARFCVEGGLRIAEVVPSDIFSWVDWQTTPRPVAARWSG